MENEEKLMTGEESLRVITEMINKTRVSIAQASFHLLLWGWLIFACSLSEFLLWKYAGWTNSWYVWFAVIIGVIASFIYGFSKGKREQVFTYGTKILRMDLDCIFLGCSGIFHYFPGSHRKRWQVYAAHCSHSPADLGCYTQLQTYDVGCGSILGDCPCCPFRSRSHFGAGDTCCDGGRVSYSRLFTQKKGQP